MLDYISHKSNRSISEEMFALMESMGKFLGDHNDCVKQFFPFIALGLVDCLEERMIENADKDNPNTKGELPLTALRSIAHHLPLDSKLLSEFVQYAVNSGVFKEEEINGRQCIWSPAVERCVKAWQKKRDAQSAGGRNNRKYKNGGGCDLQPLDEREKGEFESLSLKKKSCGLNELEKAKFEAFTQRYYATGQGANR